MKYNIRMMTGLAFGFATVATPLVSPAQETPAQNHIAKHHHYKLIDIPALGGPNSSFGVGGYDCSTINTQGTAIAQGDTSIPDPYSMVGFDYLVSHPVQWRNGVLTDLGALLGMNSALACWINSHGWVAGFSENGLTDPQTGFPETTAVLWKDGRIIDLGTLGGSSSGANAINDRGQVVGGALTTIPDLFPATFYNSFIFETYPFYFFPVTTQSHAFLWQDGKMKDLGTLGGPDSVAWFVNERGQVAGQSTIDSISSQTTGVPPVDPFFWDHGKMVDLGNFGGTFSFVAGLNNRGQITGTMNLLGDMTYHPFFWDDGVLTDLGTFGLDCGVSNAINDSGEVTGWACDNQGAVFGFLWKNRVLTNLGTVDGDACSAAHSINSRAQIVGESSPSCFDPSLPNTHAFLWENGGPIVDLNTLVVPGSELESAGGVAINDRGEIIGSRTLPNGDTHAFILIPCDENHPEVAGCDYDPTEVTSEQLAPHALISHMEGVSSVTLSPAELSTRLHSWRAGRNRRYGATQTSPQ